MSARGTALDPRSAIALGAYLLFHPLLPLNLLGDDPHVYQLALPWPHVAAAALLALVGWSARWRERVCAVPRPLVLALAAWLLAAAASAAASPHAGGPLRLELLDLVALALTSVLFAASWQRRERERLLALLAGAGTAAAIVAAIGSLRGAPLYSVAANPNAVAALLIAALPAGLERLRAAPSFARLVPPLAMVAGLLLTRSRAGLLALAAGTVVTAAIRLQRPAPAAQARRRDFSRAALALLLIAALLATALAIPRAVRALEREPRLALWAGTAQMVRAHPLLGVGPGAFYLDFPSWRPAEYALLGGVADITINPHSHPLRVAAETGLVGLAAWLAVLAAAADAARRPPHDGLRRAAVAGVLLLLAQNAVDQNLGIPIGRFWLALLLGLAASRPDAEPAPAPRQPAAVTRALTALAAVALLAAGVLRPLASGWLVYRAAHAESLETRRTRLEAALRLTPFDPRLHWMHATVVTQTETDPQAGLRAYAPLRAFAPDYAHVRLNAGVLEANAGELRAAEADLLREIELFPYGDSGYDALERLARATGRERAARRIAEVRSERAAEIARARTSR